MKRVIGTPIREKRIRVSAVAEVGNDLIPVPEALEAPLRALLKRLRELESANAENLNAISTALVEQYVVDARACLDEGDVEGAKAELDNLLGKT